MEAENTYFYIIYNIESKMCIGKRGESVMKKFSLLVLMLFIITGCVNDTNEKNKILTYNDLFTCEVFRQSMPAKILTGEFSLLEMNKNNDKEIMLLEENSCAIVLRLMKSSQTEYNIYFDFVESATNENFKTYSLSPCFIDEENNKRESYGVVNIKVIYKTDGKIFEEDLSYYNIDENNKPNVYYKVHLSDDIVQLLNDEKDVTMEIKVEDYFFYEGEI